MSDSNKTKGVESSEELKRRLHILSTLDLVRQLLGDKWTKLYPACNRKMLNKDAQSASSLITSLVKEDGCINERCNHGTSVLSYAASLGMTEIVKELLAKDDIDIDKADKEHQTPYIMQPILCNLLWSGRDSRIAT